MVLGAIGVAAGSIAIPLTAVSTATSVASLSQGVGAQQQNSGSQGDSSSADPNDPRLAKFTLRAHCSDEEDSPFREEIEDKQVILRNGKLYLDDPDPSRRKFEDGHEFSGFYVEYPWKAKPLGLVSTIKSNPPELNWIYVNEDTMALEYGGRSQSLLHLAGPWNWTDDEERVTFEDWEGFVALEETKCSWVLYYDQDDDRLSGIRGERKALECSLERILL
ncbi:uncharacterized protein EV420DRAFT_1099736 [Desarmillaria tabescens]|uniref:Uncharacterized protein n=1 Tax=Armillaria tabescens TaxID=1929756 RepID=A0AA39NDF8_ARMTA|nr:uncharacterized protein EV420DRAFT_1099736 [Desarmillaria tabescens]KAK0463621.1 hypothetical protein EV420DRAFT_1099736 [Desarmillaria tabescens]